MANSKIKFIFFRKIFAYFQNYLLKLFFKNGLTGNGGLEQWSRGKEVARAKLGKNIELAFLRFDVLCILFSKSICFRRNCF